MSTIEIPEAINPIHVGIFLPQMSNIIPRIKSNRITHNSAIKAQLPATSPTWSYGIL